VNSRESRRRFLADLLDDYAAYIEQHGPGERWRDEDYLVLWPADQLMAMNEAYRVAVYAPGRIIFASDGMGDAFAFDLRGPGGGVVRFPFIGMGDRYEETIAPTFGDFIGRYSNTGEGGVPADHEWCDVDPIVLGGDPADPKNRQLLPRELHIQAVNWWNKAIADVTRER